MEKCHLVFVSQENCQSDNLSAASALQISLQCCIAGDGVTLCVGVHYEASSPRRIALRFQEAGFSDVRITSLTEALIAPAILPRGWIQQQILLAIKEVSQCMQLLPPMYKQVLKMAVYSLMLCVPIHLLMHLTVRHDLIASCMCMQASLTVPLPFASRQGRSGVGEYLLSFLDESMLVGRAQNGTFVFIRDQ